MLLSGWYHFPTWASLGVIVGVPSVTVVASLRAEGLEERRTADADVGSSS